MRYRAQKEEKGDEIQDSEGRSKDEEDDDNREESGEEGDCPGLRNTE